ncbi:alpha/beta hydrolase [Jiangella rhizosphaerae]|uniref:Alpha/beta hydrolase n=1 Tax=Jiangella rhizosphaerae TaxID=2293569 RepID=A0A418KGU2_9ACTN|nr:alpha/beta hydrolase [Jiangella rhizosphaerae]RIQ11092.1 alpha/beta hydrolase [Jiangella rhizosphaerae]
MSSVRVENDLVYATVDGVRLALDLYRAPQPDAPLVLYVHGGGWRHGDKAEDGPRRLLPLAERGVTVASADYRLLPDAVFPDQVHDLKAAVRWLRAHGADLELATERIGIWGASAGAYLGSLLALTPGDETFEGTVGGHRDQSSAVQAVVHWFGPSDLLTAGSRSRLETRLLPFAFEADLLGVPSVADAADQARELSLLSRASAQAPPFLIAHGDRDRIVAPSEGAALHQALSRAGASSRFDLLGGAGHEDAAFDDAASLALTAAWLRAVLRPDGR